jgi:hypothetical protein
MFDLDHSCLKYTLTCFEYTLSIIPYLGGNLKEINFLPEFVNGLKNFQLNFRANDKKIVHFIVEQGSA